MRLILTFINFLDGTKCFLNRSVVIWGMEVQNVNTIDLQTVKRCGHLLQDTKAS